jgi:hypothetical protein
MSGSNASNLGYGEYPPLHNVNPSLVNVGGTNNPASFGSNETGRFCGLAGAANNVDAAAGILKGGVRKLKRKIKNITKQYKRMKAGSRKIKHIRRSIQRRFISRKRASSLAGGRRKRTRSLRKRVQRGGYAQYQNNMPISASYQVAGVPLAAGASMLANPPPVRPNSTWPDNYNHYAMAGSPSQGH